MHDNIENGMLQDGTSNINSASSGDTSVILEASEMYMFKEIDTYLCRVVSTIEVDNP